MWKKIIIMLLIILAMTVPTFASWKARNVDNERWGLLSFSIWTDDEYGVDYIVCSNGDKISICPRYKPDGSLVYNTGD